MRFFRFFLALCLSLLVSSQASAHLISAGFGSITITHDQTRLLIGVPVSLFKGIDQDGDGLLQPDEIQEGRARMIEQLQSAIQLRLGEHVGVTVDDQLMVSVKLDQKSSTNQIEWLHKAKLKNRYTDQFC